MGNGLKKSSSSQAIAAATALPTKPSGIEGGGTHVVLNFILHHRIII